MSVNNKMKLSNIVYYTLAVVTLIFAGFFIYALIINNVAMWAKVVYFIWTALVIGVVIYDIICINNRDGKTLTGLVVYVLSVLALIVACVLYFMNSGANGLADNFFNLFISISLISLITTGFMIATWCVGAKLVNHKVENKELENSKM